MPATPAVNRNLRLSPIFSSNSFLNRRNLLLDLGDFVAGVRIEKTLRDQVLQLLLIFVEAALELGDFQVEYRCSRSWASC